MEPNRRWHDPVVGIFSNLITPGTSSSAEAYDMANRRWYRLDVDAEVEDEAWLSSTVAKHVREFYAANQTLPPWNTIKTTVHGSPVTFMIEPEEVVDRQITRSLSYGLEPAEKLQTTTFDQLTNLTYLSRSVDRCIWHGKDCVFKRIEFNADIRHITAEIRIQDTLLNAIGSADIADASADILRRFSVVPILAVVIGNAKPWKPGTVAGILAPFAGQDLEILTRDADAILPITLPQLLDLVRGVQELGRCGLEHGDIKFWNTVLTPTDKEDATAKLVLIDIGSLAPDYPGDAKALGTVLLWCLEHTPTLRENVELRARVEAAVAALSEEDFDAAQKFLSSQDA